MIAGYCAYEIGFAHIREAMSMDAAEDTAALTLEIGSGRVPYRDFQELVGAFTGLLNAVSDEACGDPKAVHWEISVSEGSVLIAARLPATTDAKVASRIHKSLLRPPRRIRQNLRRFPRAVPATRLLIGADRQDILANNQKDTDPHSSQMAEYGTVEGILDTLSARGRYHFTISEPIWHMAVQCTVPDDLIESMRGMWRQRVAAHGLVRYDREGLPTSIRAEEVRPFPYDESPISDYRGLLASG